MSLKTIAKFTMPKPGNKPWENEDKMLAAWPEDRTRPARIAMSDGASESAFAGKWAEAIVWAYLRSPEKAHGNPQEWMAIPQKWWRRKVPWDRIPWHGRAKTESGAHATLLGISIGQTPDETGAHPWQAVAVGDTCLFVKSEGETTPFPIDSSRRFGNNPELICSNPANNQGLETKLKRQEGRLSAGGLLAAATDALSQWIIARIEKGEDPWDELLRNASPGRLPGWIAEKRAGRELRHDDIAFIAIQVQA